MYCIFDIETVPDAALWTAPAPKARAKADPFPPLYAHRPIAIGYLLLSDECEIHHLGVAGTSTYGDDERGLLGAWSKFMENRHVLVSYNGRGFDMPVISLRSLRHGVPLQWHSKEYRNKYGDQHMDLMDSATEYGAVHRTGFSLSNMSAVIGLSTKGGMDGSKVAGMFAAGKIAEIENYCQQDVARTAFLFMRYQLLRGFLSLEAYRAAAMALFSLCGERQLTGVTFGADTQRLLLEA